jgi:hypothetical protein
LFWNIIKIDGILEDLKSHGEKIENEMLSQPFKHVLPNGPILWNKEMREGYAWQQSIMLMDGLERRLSDHSSILI